MRIQKTASYLDRLQGKKIAVIGLGVSHYEMIKLFLQNGLDVTVCDKSSAEQIGERFSQLCALGAKFLLGETYLDHLCQMDVVFRTPGMYYYHDKLTQARSYGVAVTSETEWFFEECPCPIYAVTGSDGKTTTTTLISEMLKAHGKVVHLGGNIGKALFPQLTETQKEDCAVVELSSFQLLSMRQSPDVAVVTNIAPNHLDVHKDMQEYIDAKCNLLWHQNAFSKAILNLDNEPTYQLRKFVRGELLLFSRRQPVKHGAYLNKDGFLVRVRHEQEEVLFHYSKIRLPGMHNVENYLAAICAVGFDVTKETIENVATSFGGVEHRIEYVRTVDGVKYYNDSIASSPTRTIAGLYSFNQKLIVIAGGYDKKIPYAPLAPHLIDKVKILILLGKTAPKIEQAVTSHERFDPAALTIVHVNTLEEAVAKAKELAESGDIVTLSPASASFDLYKNFEERGEHFKKIVREL